MNILVLTTDVYSFDNLMGCLPEGDWHYAHDVAAAVAFCHFRPLPGLVVAVVGTAGIWQAADLRPLAAEFPGLPLMLALPQGYGAHDAGQGLRQGASSGPTQALPVPVSPADRQAWRRHILSCTQPSRPSQQDAKKAT